MDDNIGLRESLGKLVRDSESRSSVPGVRRGSGKRQGREVEERGGSGGGGRTDSVPGTVEKVSVSAKIKLMTKVTKKLCSGEEPARVIYNVFSHSLPPSPLLIPPLLTSPPLWGAKVAVNNFISQVGHYSI